MSDTDEPTAEAPEEDTFEERSISQVGRPSRGSSTLVAIVAVTIVGLLLWFVNRGGTPETDTRLTDAEDLNFDAPQRRDPPELNMPMPSTAVATVPTTPNTTAPPDPFDRELRRLALQQAEAQRQFAEQRRRAPILIVDQKTPGLLATPGNAAIVNAAPPPQGWPSAGAPAAESSVAADETVANATFLRDADTTIAQGALIRGVLETAIQSDLPGPVRAVVAHDVYAFDGSRILIPKASRLIGHYRSALLRGQTRVFIVWDRLLRSDGASILIDSTGTDLLGRTGLSGDLDTHFFKIFGSSILLSLIDGGVDVAIENARGDSDTTTILENGNSLSRAAEVALENSINIPPTIHVDQGTPIQVFVARDLSFRDVTMR